METLKLIKVRKYETRWVANVNFLRVGILIHLSFFVLLVALLNLE